MLSILVDNAAPNEQLTVNITSNFSTIEIFVMSYNFMPCNFDGPPFSCPSFSATTTESQHRRKSAWWTHRQCETKQKSQAILLSRVLQNKKNGNRLRRRIERWRGGMQRSNHFTFLKVQIFTRVLRFLWWNGTPKIRCKKFKPKSFRMIKPELLWVIRTLAVFKIPRFTRERFVNILFSCVRAIYRPIKSSNRNLKKLFIF